MISNNATVKLKPLKTSCHELDSENEIAVKGQGSVREGPEGDVRRAPFGSRDCYNSRTVVSNKDRDKSDFRPASRNKYGHERTARGNSYRSANTTNNRSKGSFLSDSRKSKTFADSGSGSQKYESSKDGTKGVTGKLYESPDSGTKFRSDAGGLNSDDSKISKVLRRLAREDDPEKFISLAKQLQENIMLVENSNYIKHSLDLIVESILDLLHTAPNNAAKLESAKCLGKIGYALESSFKRFLDWLFQKFNSERNDEVKILLMKSLLETMTLEKEKPVLKEFSVNLMAQMKLALESTDLPELLIASVEVILIMIEIYPESFQKHFRDTVDILVGWGLSLMQPNSLINFAVESLKKLEMYWVSEYSFAMSLLKQFLEDTEGYLDDLHAAVTNADYPDVSSPSTSIAIMIGLLKIFNAVTDCVAEQMKNSEYLATYVTKMISVVMKACSLIPNDGLIKTANVGTSLLLSQLHGRSGTANQLVVEYVKTQLDLLDQFEDETVISSLQFMTKVVQELGPNLPSDFASLLLGPDSSLPKLRLSDSHLILNQLVVLHQSLLNESALQTEVFGFIFKELELTLKTLTSTVSDPDFPYSIYETEIITAFHLEVLSACKMNTVAFDMLLKTKPSDPELGKRSPIIQHSLLWLIYTHSSMYQHFISDSNLLIIGRSSIMYDYFPNVLSLVTEMLEKKLCVETVHLLLRWCKEIILESQPFLHILLATHEYQSFLSGLIRYGRYSFSDEIVMEVCSCLFLILNNSYKGFETDLLKEIISLCVHHQNSTNPQIADKYSQLFLMSPISHALKLTTKSGREDLPNGFGRKPVKSILQDHFGKGSYGYMESRHFAIFMDYLLQGVESSNCERLKEIFMECYPLQLQNPTLGEHDQWLEMKQTCLENNSVLFPWVCWEAAQLCVLNKLRTPLGKPPETFTRIENAIRSFAKQTKTFEFNLENNVKAVDELKRCRLLLEFFEYLEKVIYNASEGTASALLAPPKNVRTFFHANKATCASWLNRIRLAVIVVAMHAGESAVAVRNGQYLLNELSETKNTQGQEFEVAVMYMAWALLSLGESEAIAGLFVWCRQDAEKKFLWLKPIADHAGGRYEIAAEGYKSILLDECNSKTSALHDMGKGSDGICVSPVKHIKSTTPLIVQRFIHDCLIDCYKKTHDYENLKLWISNADEIVKDSSGSSNGTNVEKFYHHSCTRQDVEFVKSLQEIVVNKISKYQSKNNKNETLVNSEPEQTLYSNFPDIQYIDTSILEAKISYVHEDRYEDCKKTLSQLCDWTRIENQSGLETRLKSWSCYDLTENLRNRLIKNSILVNIGKSLENNSCVFQMSENNKIEIDLHFKLLLKKWGVQSYDFELSNILKGIKEYFIKNKSVIRDQVEEGSSIVNAMVKESLRSGSNELFREIIILSFVCRNLTNELNQTENLNFDFNFNEKFSSDVLLSIDFWKRLLNENDSNVNIVKSARKEGNYNLSKRALLWHFSDANPDKNLIEISDDLIENFNRNLKVEEGELCLQVAKLLYCTGAYSSAIDFASLLALKLIRPDNSTDHKRIGSRILLTLAKWLQREGFAEDNSNMQTVNKLIEIQGATNGGLEVLTMPHMFVNEQKIIPDSDMVIGRILSMSVSHCPTLAKTWSCYASWCYRWGRKMVDVASRAGGSLSELDLVKIKQILPHDTSEDQLHEIITILSHTRAVADEDNIEAENLNTTEMIKSQLQSVTVLSTASHEVLAVLVDIWRDAQSRIYSGFYKAAQAYFKYLQLCCYNRSGNFYTITATLRILRLLVKHALELQSILEEELPRTPTRPWQCIIPQLFSRLNHPESYVRRRLSELLCRIAEVSQNLIIFPAVVGSSAGGTKRIADINTSTSKLLGTCLSQNSNGDNAEEEEEEDDDEEDDEDEEEEDDEESAASTDVQGWVLRNCFQSMVDTLSKQAPTAVEQVQTFVTELRRVTLLWDELWLGTLNQHHTELNRRLTQLEQEVCRVENNSSLTAAEKATLIAEKHRIILKPVVFILEQLYSITSVPPQTPHESWFQEKFGDAIKIALEKLKNPTDPRKPMDSWHYFKAIHAKLQKKRVCSSLKMEAISPILANMKNTAIAMPGLTTSSFGDMITVTSIDNSIIVLPTKTKPKKLVFHGSDGNSYTYLFKGLEDLHLDERIMQFLTISNTMMASSGDTSYQARHYSVTPLGPRSGLISWVDDVTPLFSLYKKWQQRDSANSSLKQGSANNSVHATMRPSEMFYAKLTPLLKEAGIHIENRKDWPLSILKKVLQELMAETPKDLLAKELWCTSINADEWWMSTRRYCKSVAVMSVIGYIIGLGDRHLDNVLIDLNTGEMVHIDYNVCFEKGKTLRVPEKVPFRMTQNIKTALGVTGVEGQFRLACEHVLKMVKKGRDTLLPLLEAFVYDPLIDWTPGSETGYTGAVYGGGEAVLKETRQSRKALEREVTKAMFIVRVTEMKAEWLENRDQILRTIPKMGKLLTEYHEVAKEVKKAEENLADAHQQMALVKEAEAQGHKHPLFNLASRCSVLLKARSALNTTVKMLKDRSEEYDRDINNYLTALSNIKGETLSRWVKQLSSKLHPDSFQTFDLVKEFLQTAGQSNMVSQCDQTESEVGQLDQQQRQTTRNCVDLLGEYATLVALYPSSLENHRSKKYKIWTQSLLRNVNSEVCQEVLSDFRKTYGNERPNGQVTAKQVVAYASALQSAVTDAQNKLKKSLEKMQTENLPDASVRFEQNYQEMKGRISEFVKTDKKSGLAVELVTIASLCAINGRFIQMEIAAKSAEEELVGMRLKEGQGWLEEMYVVSGLINEMISLLPTQSASAPIPDAPLESVVNCLKKARSIFHGLLELNFNFHSIILPEALKWMQTEHSDMLSTVSELDEIVKDSGITLDDLQVQLKLHLRCLIMGMQSPHSDVQAIVSYLRSKFETLLQRPCEDASKSPGQMLLMGFNGLFEKLQVEGSQLTTALCSLNVPSVWKKIDQLKESNTLTALILNENTRSVTEDIFLVKRIQTMQEFFQLCHQAGKAFRGVGAPVVHDDERLGKPVRRFTAEYVSRTMLGVTSQTLATALCLLLERLGLNVTGEIEERDLNADGKISLENLCRRAVEVSLHKNLTSNHAISQASTWSNSFQTVYKQREKASLAVQNAEAKNRCLTRLQVLLTAHSWYHEDILQESFTNNMNAINRSTFMTKLRKSSSSLMSLQPKLAEAREIQRTLVGNVEQRLKWAAGANPAVHEVMAAFESSVTLLDKRLDEDQALATVVANTCAAILRHEALRTRTTEALSNDEIMLKMIEQCEETSSWLAGCAEYVSPAEESLLKLMTPDYSNDPKSLQKLETKISENIESMKNNMQSLGESLFVARQNYEGKLHRLRSLLGNHHSLMTEVRHLLKSMVKFEECSSSGLPQFLDKYKRFSEEVSFINKQLSVQEPDHLTQDIESAKALLQKLPEKIVDIYNELIGFASDENLRENTGAADKKRPVLLKQENLTESPATPNRDPKTGKAVQERNAYAMNVWRRIQMKLEGRDPDPGRRSNVHEQIDYIIREATSLDNLALLYEGWTPWV